LFAQTFVPIFTKRSIRQTVKIAVGEALEALTARKELAFDIVMPFDGLPSRMF